MKRPQLQIHDSPPRTLPTSMHESFIFTEDQYTLSSYTASTPTPTNSSQLFQTQRIEPINPSTTLHLDFNKA